MKRAFLSNIEKKAGVDITSFFKRVKVDEKNGNSKGGDEKDIKDKNDEEKGHSGEVPEEAKVFKEEVKSPEAGIKHNSKSLTPSISVGASFNKNAWVQSLNLDQKKLLELEINTIHDSWLLLLYKELTKPYFLKLKEYVIQEQKTNTIFPPPQDIYSWSRLTPLQNTKVLIIGQDPYHNYNQAHGLAFSVKDPNTKIPPSLQNIYKTIAIEYPEFKVPKKNANLTPWATDGVLMLNTCLTVRAHNANSHSQRGWEIFTREVVRSLIQYKNQNNDKLCIMCWGGPAQKLLSDLKKNASVKDKIMYDNNENLLLLKCCHPSPLSAHRGDFFHCGHFTKCNEWLCQENAINWIDIKDI